MDRKTRKNIHSENSILMSREQKNLLIGLNFHTHLNYSILQRYTFFAQFLYFIFYLFFSPFSWLCRYLPFVHRFPLLSHASGADNRWYRTLLRRCTVASVRLFESERDESVQHRLTVGRRKKPLD